MWWVEEPRGAVLGAFEGEGSYTGQVVIKERRDSEGNLSIRGGTYPKRGVARVEIDGLGSENAFGHVELDDCIGFSTPGVDMGSGSCGTTRYEWTGEGTAIFLRDPPSQTPEPGPTEPDLPPEPAAPPIAELPPGEDPDGSIDDPDEDRWTGPPVDEIWFPGIPAVAARTAPSPADPSRPGCGHRLGTRIAGAWEEREGATGPLGCPVGDAQRAPRSPTGTAGVAARFAGGPEGGGPVVLVAHLSGPRSGRVFEVGGCFLRVYDELGGTGSWLGFPTGEPLRTAIGSRLDFEGGYVVWPRGSDRCEAHRTGAAAGP